MKHVDRHPLGESFLCIHDSAFVIHHSVFVIHHSAFVIHHSAFVISLQPSVHVYPDQVKQIERVNQVH
jgi:hypothetical protein